MMIWSMSDQLTIIYADRQTGKTTLVADLAAENDIDTVIVVHSRAERHGVMKRLLDHDPHIITDGRCVFGDRMLYVVTPQELKTVIGIGQPFDLIGSEYMHWGSGYLAEFYRDHARYARRTLLIGTPIEWEFFPRKTVCVMGDQLHG